MIIIDTNTLSPAFEDLDLGTMLEDNKDLGIITYPGNEEALFGKIPEYTKIYSIIPNISCAQDIIDFHKYSLGVENITPLFDVDTDFGELKNLGPVGLYNVTSKDSIEEYEVITEHKPPVVRLSVNPLEYHKELMDYCKSSEIDTLGTDIFGPRILTEYYLSIFPENFLQAFGEHNVTDIEIPGDPYLISRVMSRLGKGKENPKILEYTGDVNRVPGLKSPGQKIFQSCCIEVPGVGQIEYPGNIGKFTVKQRKPVISLGNEIWEDTDIPEDINPEDLELLGMLHKYHVYPEIEEMHPRKIWKSQYKKIFPDFWIIKVTPRKWLGWLWKEYVYWLVSGKLYKMPSGRSEILING